ncbi:hypothetical protein B0H16DRAFT_606676 [Mycena metata]|uniref:Uncharacterized protein n=1 Tax=Mycena metata TaxID=1033252 RepID=A0AAD7KB81_9AGAR|nr:hypothetical protein B0H16DRAFT_606676 [Mycena metata]
MPSSRPSSSRSMLTADERVRLLRSNKKIQALLGESPRFVEGRSPRVGKLNESRRAHRRTRDVGLEDQYYGDEERKSSVSHRHGAPRTPIRSPRRTSSTTPLVSSSGTPLVSFFGSETSRASSGHHRRYIPTPLAVTTTSPRSRPLPSPPLAPSVNESVTSAPTLKKKTDHSPDHLSPSSPPVSRPQLLIRVQSQTPSFSGDRPPSPIPSPRPLPSPSTSEESRALARRVKMAQVAMWLDRVPQIVPASAPPTHSSSAGPSSPVPFPRSRIRASTVSGGDNNEFRHTTYTAASRRIGLPLSPRPDSVPLHSARNLAVGLLASPRPDNAVPFGFLAPTNTKSKRAGAWSGEWNEDMEEVIKRLRELKN